MSGVTEQHMDALALANAVRTTLCKLKRDLQGSTLVEAAEYMQTLLSDPERLAGVEGRLRVGHAVLAIPRMGDVTAASVLRKAGILNYNRKLAELTDRQRQALCLELRCRQALWEFNQRKSGRAA